MEAPYWDFQTAAHQTKKALDSSPPYIYEAFFEKEQLIARVDILHLKKSSWDIIEVKSSLSLKEDHLWDMAIQKYVLDKCFDKIENCFLMHINKACVYPHLEYLFIKKNVTDQVNKLIPEVEKKVIEFKNTLNQTKAPQVEIGPHCKKPYPCRFMHKCWSLKGPSVFNIPGLGEEESWNYFHQNKVHLKDIPDQDLIKRQCVYKKVQLTGKPYINKINIKKEISSWKFPLYYLDFETLSSAIPRFPSTKPFQHIPFQFSCLKQNNYNQKKGNEDLQDFEKQITTEEHYLHLDSSDARKFLTEKLAQFIGEKGHVVAYYKQFESCRLKELSALFPEFSKILLSIESRLVDPLPLLREEVCFKDFGSSWSMKSVAPVLLGKKWSYSQLDVQDGLMAQNTFEQMIQLKNSDPQKEILRKNLISYCRQDTLCLAGIVNWLFMEAL